MNVLEALTGVIPVQLAATLMGVTPALATLDTQAVDFIVRVSTFFFNLTGCCFFILCHEKPSGGFGTKLNPIVHFWLHHTAHCGSVRAERVGQGEVGGVTRRVTCTWWWLGLAVKAPWLGPGEPTLALAAWQAYKTLLSPCRELISGREGLLGL